MTRKCGFERHFLSPVKSMLHGPSGPKPQHLSISEEELLVMPT